MDGLALGLGQLGLDEPASNGNGMLPPLPPMPPPPTTSVEVTPDVGQLKRELEELTERLSELQSSLFEIEEARHSALPQPPSDPSLLPASPPTKAVPSGDISTQSRLDLLLQAFTSHLESFSTQISRASISVSALPPISSTTSPNPNPNAGVTSPDPTTTSPPTSPRAPTPSRRRPRQSLHSTATALARAHRDVHKLLDDLQRGWADLVERDEGLREELMEDRLVGVFRETAKHAEGMMDSLDKAIMQCSTASKLMEGRDAGSGSAPGEVGLETVIDEVLATLGSYDQKKKFYVPVLTKNFTILDKGLKERTTANGEVLRRHAELSIRWHALRASITETDALVPQMRRQINAIQSTANGDMAEGDESEQLMDEKPEALSPLYPAAAGPLGMNRAASEAGRGGPKPPAGVGMGTPPPAHMQRAKTSGIPTSTSGSSRGSGMVLGQYQQGAGVDDSPTTARQRAISGPELAYANAVPGKGKGFMNALKRMSMGGKALRSPPLAKSEFPTPSLVGSMYSAASSAQSPPPESEASTSYFDPVKVGTSRMPMPKFASPKPRWNGSTKIEDPRVDYDLREHVDSHGYGLGMDSPSAGRARQSLGRRKSMLMSEASDDGDRAPTVLSHGSSPEREMATPTKPTPVVNRRRSYLPVPTHHSTVMRPTSPAFSATSTTASQQQVRRASYAKPPSTASPSPGRSRAASNADMLAPPVPPMPNREQLQAKEARAAYMRSSMQTPEPMLRMNAARMPFYTARQPSAGFMTPSSRVPSSSGSDVMDSRRLRTPSRQGLAPPSAFKSPSRPGSAAGTARAGAATPVHNMRGGLTFVPNKLDELDVALAKLLDELPNDIRVDRLDPPLRKGQVHTGEWKGRYALSLPPRGRKEYELRLLILNKPGTGPGGKTQKVMIRDGNVTQDLRLFILDAARYVPPQTAS